MEIFFSVEISSTEVGFYHASNSAEEILIEEQVFDLSELPSEFPNDNILPFQFQRFEYRNDSGERGLPKLLDTLINVFRAEILPDKDLKDYKSIEVIGDISPSSCMSELLGSSPYLSRDEFVQLITNIRLNGQNLITIPHFETVRQVILRSQAEYEQGQHSENDVRSLSEKVLVALSQLPRETDRVEYDKYIRSTRLYVFSLDPESDLYEFGLDITNLDVADESVGSSFSTYDHTVLPARFSESALSWFRNRTEAPGRIAKFTIANVWLQVTFEPIEDVENNYDSEDGGYLGGNMVICGWDTVWEVLSTSEFLERNLEHGLRPQEESFGLLNWHDFLKLAHATPKK